METMQDVLQQRIVAAIRDTDGADLEDILMVLATQLVYWQQTLFTNLRVYDAQEGR